MEKLFDPSTMVQEQIQWFEQAKKMEEEQITDAHIEGQRVFDEYPHTQWTNDQAELYYNETFNTKER
jgi:phosphoribosylformylglycinamidine (FGAM) synthase-like amidotransferase family enzyme